ncbi:DUF2505 domain-containing protein [Mycobacterium sp. TNTM28]|uniref:DUF2505 domain-containing protein n=1 Tax=[Mycobacterium] fortunisiensis TaxID=2600579 RepID=A0ABS6KHM5_9MYCO|nr:DUF2505 domain-containing protein [[Mycobacterium] fortunisiensis]MBU9763065.1 DUF2505 domain-containing protein [[Mycobacterium] fortunisiensis]
MARSFDGSTESPASVEQIHAAFGREDYWLARLAGSDAATTTLDSLTVDADGTVTVRLTQHLGRQLLPKVVANLVPGELNLVHQETWTPDNDGQVHGQIQVSVPGGLGSCRAKTWLAPADTGSRLRFTGRVDVKIPLVGGNLEKTIGASLSENIPEVVRFTTTWVTENA